VDIAIRSSVGGSRFRLVRQMVTEGVLLSLLSGIAGFALAYGIAALRSEICSKLEPLTVDLVTSVIAEPVKSPDFNGLVNYIQRVVDKQKRR
jgi:ABC-type antimicrobial peptide transport system permease subunit